MMPAAALSVARSSPTPLPTIGCCAMTARQQNCCHGKDTSSLAAVTPRGREVDWYAPHRHSRWPSQTTVLPTSEHCSPGRRNSTSCLDSWRLIRKENVPSRVFIHGRTNFSFLCAWVQHADGSRVDLHLGNDAPLCVSLGSRQSRRSQMPVLLMLLR